VPTQPTYYSEPPLVGRSTHRTAIDEDDDQDLKAAIEASLREANAPKPSAPLETPRSEDAPVTYGQQPYPPRSSSLVKIPSYELEPLESDVILTFSQTVEQVHSQGGRDMSRYPAVGELYDKANGLRPKLVASLDDADRKERECLVIFLDAGLHTHGYCIIEMLSEMHDKLSQIVKLYDKALTEHVSHHSWRSPQPTPLPLTYQQSYAPANGWAPPNATPLSPAQQPQYMAQPGVGTSHIAQAPAQGYPQQAGDMSQAPAQRHPQQPEQQQQVPQPPQTYAPPAKQQYFPQQQQPIQQSPVLQPQAPQHQQYVVQNPVQVQPTAPAQSIASAQPQYSQPQVPTTAPPQASTQYRAPSSPPEIPQHIPSSPAQYIPSAPTKSHIPQQPSLSRHNTISYAPTSPPPIANNNSNGFLARHNTVNYASTRQQPHYQQSQQQLQQQQQTVLPQFPSVPTSAPQAFNVYSPPVPQPAAERKEALLIDL
jgi:hepatocyte growth factor-regulated tyrosine kinase substrate